MKRFQNIFVATDVRLDHHPIVEEAVELALRNNASLTIVDVVPDLPWLARLAMDDPRHLSQLMMVEKREKLAAIAEAIRKQGISVTTRVLSGQASVEIIREVLRGGHDLLMRVSKGKSSRRTGFFGTTGIELLHKCPCPVWLVCPTTNAKFRHVLACVNTSSDEPNAVELNGQVIEIADGIREKHEADMSILHAWSIDGEQFMKRRMREGEFEAMNAQRYKLAHQRTADFLASCSISGDDPRIQLVKGVSTEVIPRYAREHAVDLVVVGTGAHQGPASWVLGNVAEQILGSLERSVLAIKPDGFVSPIRLERETVNA